MRVMCIKGHTGVLEEGEVYHVSQVTKKGHYLLFEVDPPNPYLCFNKDRFVPLTDSDLDEELVELQLEKQYGGE